jgi:hypothetical protein
MAKSVAKWAAGIAAGAVSVQLLRRGLVSATKASFEHEDSIKRLDFALTKFGGSAQTSTRAMDEWAESVQDLTGVSSDAVLGMASLALGFGATVPVAKLAATGAIDFAAATGKEVNMALNQVVKTLGGYRGELGESLPEVMDLTVAQLKAGEAAVLMAEKYSGAAKDMGREIQRGRQGYGHHCPRVPRPR